MRTRSSWIQFHTVLLSMAAMALLSGGCAAVGPKPDGGAVGQIIRESSAPSGGHGSANAPSRPESAARPASQTIVEVWGQKLKNTRFDYPVMVNTAVEQWISYFTGKGRRFFEKYLERSRYFIPVISKTMKNHNMPQDLVYLAMIESGFNNSARSRARAVGPWQFMKFTGTRYGLTVDYWLDERRDTRKSTLAAIAYLKELYQEFGSWELSSAAYNAGENKVRRAIAKYHTHDFWEIARHRFFKRETRDYVPKIIAAAIITKNPGQFGFQDPFGSGARNPTIHTVAENGTEERDELTPKELGEPDATPDIKDDTAEDLAETDSEKDDDSGDVAGEGDESEDPAIALETPNPMMSPSVYMVSNPGSHVTEFEIKGPADLFAISKASGLPYSTVKLLNPELLRWCTPPQMKTYRIRLPLSVKEHFLATYNDESFDRRVVFLRYTVRRGDTLQKVARRFGVESSPIRDLNQLAGNALRVGSAINLPIPTGYKRVIASMYDEKPAPPSRRRRHGRRRRHRQAAAVRHQRLRPSLTESPG